MVEEYMLKTMVLKHLEYLSNLKKNNLINFKNMPCRLAYFLYLIETNTKNPLNSQLFMV